MLPDSAEQRILEIPRGRENGKIAPKHSSFETNNTFALRGQGPKPQMFHRQKTESSKAYDRREQGLLKQKRLV